MAKEAPKEPSTPGGQQKTFTADTVAALLMALGSVSITTEQYAMMSALDGQRTASSFQHQFRSVLQKARELKTRVETGEKFDSVEPSKKRGATSSADTTPAETPTKKAKATPRKSRAKKAKTESPVKEEKEEKEADGEENGFENGDEGSFFAEAINGIVKEEPNEEV